MAKCKISSATDESEPGFKATSNDTVPDLNGFRTKCDPVVEHSVYVQSPFPLSLNIESGAHRSISDIIVSMVWLALS